MFFEVADRLGGMTVKELRQRMDSWELSAWMVYLEVKAQEIENQTQHTAAVNRLRRW